MKIRAIAVGFYCVLISSCAATGGTSASSATTAITATTGGGVSRSQVSYAKEVCEPLVKYQGLKVEVTGIEIPLAGGPAGQPTVFKIGKFFAAQERLQTVNDFVSLMVVTMHNDCMMFLTLREQDPMRREIYARHDRTRYELLATMKVVERAETDAKGADALKAINESVQRTPDARNEAARDAASEVAGGASPEKKP